MKRPRESEPALLTNLREICLALPETAETLKWGHPTFETGGKIFAVLDEYRGRRCIAFRASTPLRQATLIRDQRFFPAPYSARYGWVCMYADRDMDWTEVAELLAQSHGAAAPKRRLAAPDPAHTVRTPTLKQRAVKVLRRKGAPNKK